MESDSSDGESYAGSALSVAANQNTVENKVIEQIDSAFDPLPLDRPIVVETQHSGLLNADTQDILKLKQKADEQAADAAEKALNMKLLVKKISSNLEWLDSRVGALESKVKRAIPIEYAQAESKVVFKEDPV